MTDAADSKPKNSILGLSTDELAGLSADELNNNPVAIKMLLHYYRQLVDENGALKNTNNTLETYVNAYTQQKSDAATSAVLLAVSNVSIGFGVNLLTGGTTWPGVASLITGIGLTAAGLYFAFRRQAS